MGSCGRGSGGGGCGSSGWSGGGSAGSQLDGVEAGGLGALGSGALAVGLLDGDADLALVEELGAVGVLVDVSLLASHQVGGVLEVVEQELVECAAFLVEDLDSVAVAVIDGAGVYDGAEGVDGLGVTGPLVVDLLADGGKVDGLASGASLEDLGVVVVVGWWLLGVVVGGGVATMNG